MINHFKKLLLETKKQFEIVDITKYVQIAIQEAKLKSGLVLVYCPHTTAGIKINHNEPLLIQDIMKSLYKLVPVDVSYGHDLFEVRQNIAPNERSNGHAHIKAFLAGSSETVPVENSTLLIGAKQSIFFVEFDGGRSREVNLKIIGE